MIDGGYLQYIWLGASHMLTGYDHLLFLFGVVFFLTNLRDITKFVTAFTIGHSITLILATFLGITANYFLVDAVIALELGDLVGRDIGDDIELAADEAGDAAGGLGDLTEGDLAGIGGAAEIALIGLEHDLLIGAEIGEHPAIGLLRPAIRILDAALAQVNSQRADLGATQNRFSATVSNLQTSAENISAARSRIQDADFAAETAALTRNQILQQAGIAMLSQANALPQNVLSLLK